ncbi:hypothetical protein O181_117475 [Austropuccinia psidii MF-1]|uniref:DUF4939 domain-containing protein n=1 Tax=Austropuccinia psidii MF-1 TaxID=1389203 RepID=A0A9Q3PYF2_9BASI|nr:hypothetical protein [Austropuccinia psidii MF-1]
MYNIQSSSSSEVSRPPDLKTPSLKAPDFFYETQPFKLRSFIQSFQLICHNDRANLPEDRKKFLYSTSFLTCRAENWIEPYLSNLTNHEQTYLLNDWASFEYQLFTLFGDLSACDSNQSTSMTATYHKPMVKLRYHKNEDLGQTISKRYQKKKEIHLFPNIQVP